MAITATIPIMTFPKREDYLDPDEWVTQAETAYDVLSGSFTTNANLFATQANALETNVNAKELSATTASTNASNSATSASNSATTATNQANIAVAAVATLPAGTINDLLIEANKTWSSFKINDELNNKQDELISGTNIKTINSSSILDSGNLSLLPSTNPVITGSITEQVYNLTGTEINPSNGTIQYKTVSANTTFTETLTAGQSVILRLIDASSYTITFPTITWVGATAPKLTANCAIVLWKEQSTLYGAYVGTLV